MALALSWDTYLKYLKHFLSISSDIDDGWTMKISGSVETPENCYLLKKVNRQNPVCEIADDGTFITDDCSDLSTVKCPSETVIWEYHILYSPSYSVPVLYFNVRNTAGKLLSLQNIWNILNVSKEVLVEKWNFVTQQEHPILLQPFFYLHPCKSFEIFALSEKSDINPIVTWLSSIAPIVHLDMPLEYGTKCYIKLTHFS